MTTSLLKHRVLTDPDRDKKYFVRRKSDGKYWRGARFWRWTRSWRRAALLDKEFWIGLVVWTFQRDNVEWEFVDPQDVEIK